MLDLFAHMNVIKVVVLVHTMMLIPKCGQASETLLPGEEMSANQTLMSASNIFELGFFTPLNSTTTYLGIWFANLPETILWVANRDTPIPHSDLSPTLTLSTDGNLKILYRNSMTIWSTNTSSLHPNSSAALLSNAGNLILKDKTSGKSVVLYDSFDHPCDVYLTTLKYEMNTKSAKKLSWSSWRSESDPAIGNFSAGFLPQIPMQCFISNGDKTLHWRSGPWNGLRFVGLGFTGYDHFDNWQWPFVQNKESGIVYFGDTQFATNVPRISKIFHDGSLRTMDWIGGEWKVTWEAITTPCDIYGACGVFGVCSAGNSPICGCLRGFVPRFVEEWGRGDWRSGCVRRTQLVCWRDLSVELETDGFSEFRRMKIPDRHEYFSSVNAEGCRRECLRNCSCSAYAYVDGIGCLLWAGELVDVQALSFSGEDLYVRLHHSELGKTKKAMIMSALLSGVFFLFFTFIFVVCKVRNKHRKRTKGIPKQLLNLKTILQEGLTTFEFEDIVAATNGFCPSNKVGEGGFGAVFRGKLHDGQEIAVKRLSCLSGQGASEFLNEISLISKLQHRNLVKIFGCSIKGEEKLIVYEYLPNRSLDAFIFDPSKKYRLDWASRFNIIQGIARGISYLHRDSRLKVIHRDLKASNVLLDDDMNPKISDFGLARAFQAAQESANTQRVVGTYGYMSPEYALRGTFSEKSDVFSFGVVVLEIISGKKTSSFGSKEEEDAFGLLRHAWSLWNQGEEVRLMDESCVEFKSEEVLRCVHVGLLCVQDRADDRPTMPAVIVMLNSDTLIPRPKQPMFVPETANSLDACVPIMCSGNEVTESLVHGR